VPNLKFRATKSPSIGAGICDGCCALVEVNLDAGSAERQKMATVPMTRCESLMADSLGLPNKGNIARTREIT
jgi:hypothetical protein